MDYKLLEEEEESKGFDIKRYFVKLGKNSIWLIMSVGLLLGLAYLYLRYTMPLYQVSTYIQLKEPSDNIAMIGGSPFASPGTGQMLSSSLSDPGNEIFKLQSSTLVGKVVDSLCLYVAAEKKGNVRNQAIGMDVLPVELRLGRADAEAKKALYILALSNESYRIKDGKNELTGRYEEPLIINGDTLTLLRKMPSSAIGGTYVLHLYDRSGTIERYRSRLKVAPASKTAVGMLEVAVKDELPSRAKQFIDVLIHCYDKDNTDFSNQALRKEMDFLNDRLITVRAELEQQENTVKNFKVQNKVTEVSAKANQLLGSLSVIDSKRNDNELKKSYLNLVEANMRDMNGRDLTLANVGGTEDPLIAGRIEKYNQLIAEKKKIQENGAPQDPRLSAINAQIEDARMNISQAIKNARREVNASDQFLASQEALTTGRFVEMPEKEKDYVQVNRVLNIKQSLYNFLLQRKEDKNIQLASKEIAESRIVDTTINNAQTPQPFIIYIAALVIGLVVPASVVLIRLLLNKKIETRKDVELLTSLPIAGEIGKTKRGNEIVISASAATSEAEQFRTLRTNISYLLHGPAPKVLLVTSSVSEEGKSFVSLNLATGLSISNKRVVLLDMDLRDPGLSRKLGLEQTKGMTNFLTGESDMQSVIQPLSHAENLFFISAGTPLQPNTGELILNERMDDLFTYLKQLFDIVVIDTPPVAPVSDALTLGKLADMSFFVIRHNFTQRSALKLINKLHAEHKLPSINLVVNGIENKKEYNYGNDFSYGYGYPKEPKKVRKIAGVNKERVV
ncbi:GumC family protein [Flavisolibacter nicotianae]|uniref:GumC family protein n=1 Tax=Flavisolibacter nicotianae TaxID=2364882 RepID=UPI000EAF258E|nr:tyrosine-protein kinase family protein [Flavisolibacter nicotianae]